MMRSDSADVFIIQRNMLTTSALWPEEHPTTWYKFRGAFCYSLCVALGITMLMEAFNDLNDFAKLSEILYIMITIIVYILKYSSLIVQRKTFIHMIKVLKNPVFLSYPIDLDSLMAKRIKASQFFANSYRFFVVTFIILLMASPFLDKRPLPFPFPYDVGHFRYLMFVFQMTAMSVVAWNNSSIDTLAACLMGLATTHLEILTEKIIRLRDRCPVTEGNEEYWEKTDEIVVKNLKQCIEHHMAIVEYVECIDQTFSFGILSQFMGSALVICNTLFHFVLISVGSLQFLALFNYFALIIAQLFMYCWFGNDVILKSLSIGEACYLYSWYSSGNEVRKYLFMIMERSKRPLKITAFKFSTLSLAAFSSIMQWSYSYFALLMKLYRNKPKTP